MTLEGWIARQRVHAARMMRRAIAPDITKARPGFFQTVTPKAGSVVASPVLGAYDPEPDYFFHWYRDSALVMDALRLVQDVIPEANKLFADFIRFSLDLQSLDGRAVPAPKAEPDFAQYLRRDLDTAHGGAIPAETRVNPDGTLDSLDWPRPQFDGPALRALALLNWGIATDDAAMLLKADLEFILTHARKPCFGVWEEDQGIHYHVIAVSAAALGRGASWLRMQGDEDLAARCLTEARHLLMMLRDWPGQEFLHAMVKPRAGKELDASVILAANQAGLVPDAKLRATRAKLDELFGGIYPINRLRTAPAWGRYASDSYYGGGAWYATTLGAAEFCYRGGEFARGDAYLETVRAFTPESGDLSEQFDRASGAQTSARHLAWSYAAFLTAVAARRAASG